MVHTEQNRTKTQLLYQNYQHNYNITLSCRLGEVHVVQVCMLA